MSTEEQIIAVAEWLGWKRETRERYAGEDNVRGWGFNTHLLLGDRGRKFVTSIDQWPAWDKDLNAMREAEIKVYDNNGTWEAYREALLGVVVRSAGYSAADMDIIALAHQRLEAICRTLWPERWMA